VSQRTRRLEKLSAQVLSEEIARLKDPRIGFVTVTKVGISPDLHHAHVVVSVLGSDEARQDTMAGLASATPHLRTQLGAQVRLKFVPELTFELDHTAETAQRVESLIRRLHSESDSASTPGEEP
jgi:ribosome-binding factor A